MVVAGACVLAGLPPSGGLAAGVRKVHVSVKPAVGSPATRFAALSTRRSWNVAGWHASYTMRRVRR